jgi:hypothetical protein
VRLRKSAEVGGRGLLTRSGAFLRGVLLHPRSLRSSTCLPCLSSVHMRAHRLSVPLLSRSAEREREADTADATHGAGQAISAISWTRVGACPSFLTGEDSLRSRKFLSPISEIGVIALDKSKTRNLSKLAGWNPGFRGCASCPWPSPVRGVARARYRREQSNGSRRARRRRELYALCIKTHQRTSYVVGGFRLGQRLLVCSVQGRGSIG